MSGIHKHRVSSAPLELTCGGAAMIAENEPRSVQASGPEALLGTAVHAIAAEQVMAAVGARDPESVAQAGLDRWTGQHVDAEELGKLCAYARIAWRELSDKCPMPRTEVAMEFAFNARHVLSGHADVVSGWTGNECVVIDWKSGRDREKNFYDQLGAYAYLTAREKFGAGNIVTWPADLRIMGCVVWLRDWECENFAFTLPVLMEWEAKYIREVIEWNGLYKGGAHCARCPRFSTCDSALASFKQTALVVQTDPDEPLPTFKIDAYSPGFVDLFCKVRALAAQCESFKDQARAAVIAVGGSIDGGDGRVLTITTSVRREIDPRKAWPVLTAEPYALNDDELAACVKIGKGALETAVAKKAPRGKGAARKRQLMEDLTAAGAVTEKESSKLELRAAAKQLEVKADE